MHVLFSTIIAGSVFGPALLRMSLMESLDAWHRRWPLMQLYLYIDDMGVLAQGTTRLITAQFFDSIADLDAVLSSVDAKLSRGEPGITGGKWVVLAPLELLSILALQFLKLGIAVIDHARNLGIDFYLSFQRHSEVRAARRSAVELRLTRLNILKRSFCGGAWKVGRCGFWPAYSYGHARTGMSQAERNFARRIVFGSAPGAASGRSKTVVLARAGFDPAVEIDAGPTFSLSDLFWEADSRRIDQLERAWKLALPEFPPPLPKLEAAHPLLLFRVINSGWSPRSIQGGRPSAMPN